MKLSTDGSLLLTAKRLGFYRSRHSLTTVFSGLLLALPAIILLSIFKLYPILSTIHTSFFEGSGFGSPYIFVGIDNFVKLVSDPLFRKAVLNTAIFFTITTIGVNVIGLLLALMVNSDIKGRTFFRTILFMPVIVSSTATALLWAFLLDPNIGLINPLLRFLNLDFMIRSWLGDPKIAMITISIISIWQSMGYHMVIYLAGLQTIDVDLYEAAKIDGASHLSLFGYITLPLLKPFIAIDLILCIIGGFSIFDLVYVLTRGGPVHATETLMTLMYFVAFKQFKQGYASAIIVSILIITAVLGIIHQRASKAIEQ